MASISKIRIFYRTDISTALTTIAKSYGCPAEELGETLLRLTNLDSILRPLQRMKRWSWQAKIEQNINMAFWLEYAFYIAGEFAVRCCMTWISTASFTFRIPSWRRWLGLYQGGTNIIELHRVTLLAIPAVHSCLQRGRRRKGMSLSQAWLKSRRTAKVAIVLLNTHRRAQRRLGGKRKPTPT